MTQTRRVLAAGLALIAIGIGLIVLRSPSVLAGTNGIPIAANLATAETAGGICQAGETLPRGTAEVVIYLTAIVGPRVSIEALWHSHVVAHGVRNAGWSGNSVTVPVRPLPHATAPVQLCLHLSELNGEVEFLGSHTAPTVAATVDGGARLVGRVRVEYLRRGHRSWLSMVAPVARRLGLGRAPGGTWMAGLAVLLVAGMTLLASRLLLRELR